METDKFGNYEGEIPERYRGYPLVANNENAVHLKGDGSVNEDGTPAESSQPLPRYLGTPAGATATPSTPRCCWPRRWADCPRR